MYETLDQIYEEYKITSPIFKYLYSRVTTPDK
jgi:hypothetical protein